MITLKEHEFIQLSSYIKDNYGINLTKKKALIEGRLTNMLIEKGFKNYSEYIKHVFSDKSKNEIAILINKLTTNHTFFMREVDHFKYFKNSILPYLENTCKNKDLRIWSAGCSSGEEPYTLAMILADYFRDKSAFWNTKILATDISVKVLETAEKGIYSSEAISNIPNTWKLNYFRKINNENFQISDKMRSEVIFRIFNLMDNTFPFKRKFHVIFCRNVMIYFDQQTKLELVNKFYNLTEIGGYLFIGNSESLNKDNTKYKYIMPGVYRKG